MTSLRTKEMKYVLMKSPPNIKTYLIWHISRNTNTPWRWDEKQILGRTRKMKDTITSFTKSLFSTILDGNLGLV